jgi:8-amino-7-oxononanoate synthase
MAQDTDMDLFDACYSYHEPELAKAAGLYPFFRSVSASGGPIVEVDGRKVIMLGSNNYLGLTHHPEVIKAAHDAIDRYGTGCTGSRFLNGNLDLHETLEEELAAFLGKPAVLVFAAGFLANVGVIGALGGTTGAVIFMATENHASLIDGARMANSRRMRVFQDVADLERQFGVEQRSWSHALVVTDGVFSMTGRVADLKGLTALRKKFGFRLYVDDAHGLGVLGSQGRGTAEAAGVNDDIDVLFGTFSKSFASQGGFVAGDTQIIDYLRHKARTFMFSAGLAPASTAAALAALRVMQKDKSLFTRLWDNVAYFKHGVEELGFQTLGTTTPIVPLFTGSETQAFRMCVEALEMGLFATPAVYPAVPPGHALIRTSVTPAHTREHLSMALDILKKLTKRYPVPTVDASTLPPARSIDLEEALMAAAAAAGAANAGA